MKGEEELGKRLAVVLLCLSLLFPVFQTQPRLIAANRSVTITSNSVNVREGPGLSYPLVKQVEKGEKYSVIKETNEWSQLLLSNGQKGWVANWLLKDNKSKSSKNSGDTQYSSAIANTNNISVRSGPGTSFQIIGHLNKKQKVEILTKNEDWYEISFSNQAAWVNSQFVDTNGNDQVKKNTDATANAKGIVGMVTANGLHIRKNASLNSNIVGTVNKDQSFPILAEIDNWTKIEYSPGKFGWIASWYLDKDTPHRTTAGQAVQESTITILEDGTNIRNRPDLQSDVVDHANNGDHFPIAKIENDWYQIKLKNGTSGYIAGWMVSINGSAPRIERPGIQSYLNDKTIVIDPGHGGQDNGTTGSGGTFEKNLTYRTANLVFAKLKAAGANVLLTRNGDNYISLTSRVNFASSRQADAFVSLHYDSSLDWNTRGMTGYYYHSDQKQLADSLYSSVLNQTGLNGRGVRVGDYHVIRENSQRAALLELGYLSNPEEEMKLNSGQFQESAATGIFLGLARYFMDH